MNNYKELKILASKFNKGYKDIENFAIQWGSSNERIDHVIREIFDLANQEEEMRLLANNDAVAYMFSELFQNPKAIRELKIQHKDELTSEGLEVLHFWEKNSWFWCYYLIKEELSYDFWTIEDLLTGEEHLFYSPYIRDMQKRVGRKDIRCFSMLFSNGGCMQYIGLIKVYLFPIYDFKFFCSVIAPSKDLKTIQSEHYPAFLKINLIMKYPIITYKNHEIAFSWHPFTLKDFAIEEIGGEWENITKGTLQLFSLKKLEEEMIDLPNIQLFGTTKDAMPCTIFRDCSTGEMAIHNNSMVAYTFLSALVQKAYPELQFPTKPSVFVSVHLQGLISEMDFPRSWKKFEEISRS